MSFIYIINSKGPRTDPWGNTSQNSSKTGGRVFDNNSFLSFSQVTMKPVGIVMERVVYKHVYNHLQSLKLIYEFQSGFLPKHSTVHQLLEMYNSILNSLERKEMSCLAII
jgi:hypothetical protein